MKVKILCEYLENPLGMDLERPRFSWICSETEKGENQRSYRLRVNKSPDFTSQGCVWDTGEVISKETVNIEYQGCPLETAFYYYYQVEITTNKGKSVLSNIGTFFTGIMEKRWQAPWIGGPLMEEDTFWFRHEFYLKKKVKQAAAYIASPNYYVFTVNGKQTTDTVLNNAWTDCEKTLLYGTCVVTECLRQGKNVLGVMLGNGWNAMDLGFLGYGVGEHLFSMELLIQYEDGEEERITTDNKTWYFSVDGPIRMNSIYQGEDYDAAKELTGWDTPDYDKENAGAKWRDAVEFEPVKGKLCSGLMEPIKVVGEIKPREIHHLSDGSYVFDMGQNFAGWARLMVEAPKGTKISMIFSELEHEDHTLNRISLRGVRAADHYICRGNGLEIYQPSFTYHGFRYVQVTGLPYEPNENTITGCVVRSAVEKIGSFTCSSKLLNQLQKNIQWTEASNLHGLPTDCPQRDERLGWLNDMTVRNECALYNYRLPKLYSKWLGDIRDTQGEVSGAITDTAPFRRFGQRPADPVSSSFLLIPWNLYCHYKDRRVIEDNYDGMKRWVAYLLRNSRDYIMQYSPMGDWAAPVGGTNLDSIGGGAVSVITPTQLMATGYLYYDCGLMAKMASVLEKWEEEQFYLEEQRKAGEAFQQMYYKAEDKYYYKNSQGSNTFPLYLGLVPQEDKEQVLNHLVEDIVEKNNTHLTTGNLCSRYLIEVLLQEGKEDLAFELLTQTSYPSWGYMIENGATTVWERWEKVTEESTLSNMASYNHPMNGAVGVSFFKHLAGIAPDSESPGFENIRIRPVVPRKLKKVQASVETIRGTVACAWEQEEDTLVLKVSIPFNCTGEIGFPVKGRNCQELTLAVDDKIIWKDGRAAGEAPCVKKGPADGEYWCFLTEAGEYTITGCFQSGRPK